MRTPSSSAPGRQDDTAAPSGAWALLRARVRADYRAGVLLLGVGVTLVWLLPFAVYRAWQGNWLATANDLALSLLLGGAAAYAWRTGDTRRAAWVVALAIVGGLWAIGLAARFAALFWTYPGVLMLFFLVPPRAAVLLALLAVTGAAVFSWSELGGSEGLPFFAFTALLTALLGYVVAQQAQRQIELWQTLSLLDALTGVGNRRLLELELAQAAARGGDVGALAVVDLDHFKAINDRLGHDGGDAVLRQFASVAQAVLRKTDRLYRLGGEEFVLWLPPDEPQAVRALLQRLRAAVAERVRAGEAPVTFSAGVARHTAGEPWTACLARADAALYRAKRAGRDRLEEAWDATGQPARTAD
ncbi:putative diguanylate cyclase YdaM [Tepidimonas alkaliphilus]|uniref:diguanylate cyclase n=1 Tax=Tepidimonas alkaliphilus TaxID=2588942 RepID=A0A554W4D8_9BURK|nr:GGDEF domain-containing protein [Tepidimonas alkaliphilus]TSE18433.1 putative diguanylate cyclase YdaM [Tepidimonas alkaliphilus]